MSIKKFIARLYDLPNAYRVLDIMDEAGCDIELAENAHEGRCWKIKPKWYVTEKEARDLQEICLFGKQYKKRNPIATWIFHKVFFRTIREGARVLKQWF